MTSIRCRVQPRLSSLSTKIGEYFIALTTFVILSGCGGGSKDPTTVSTNTGNALESVVGPFITRVVGANQNPVVVAGKAATVTALSGAAFTDISELRTHPTNLLDDSRLFVVYAGPSGGWRETRTMNINGGEQQTVDTTPLYYADWSPDGTKIASSWSGNQGIITMNPDGSGRTTVVAGSYHGPRYNRDGTRLTFWGGSTTTHIYIAQIPNGVVTMVAADGIWPDYSPQGHVVFQASASSARAAGIWRAIPGSGEFRLTTSAEDFNPEYSSDGAFIAFSRSNVIHKMNADGSNIVSLAAPGNYPRWSPDGTKIAFIRGGDVWIMNSNGTGQTNITASPLSESEVVWSPLFRRVPRKIIGTGGLLGTGAAGFIFGSQNKTVTSVATFDTAAAVRTAARVNPIGPNDKTLATVNNLIFDVSGGGNNLTNFAYVNGKGKADTIVGPGAIASAGGIFVYFDANDGQIAAVLPYAPTRGTASAPVVETQGGNVVLRGNFLAAFDRAGKNLAPAGTRSVIISANGTVSAR